MTTPKKTTATERGAKATARVTEDAPGAQREGLSDARYVALRAEAKGLPRAQP